MTSMSTPILASWRRAALFMARQLTMPKRVKRSSCAEIDVFGHRQVEHQRLLLEHHADAVPCRVARVAQPQLLAVERERAGIRPVGAGQNPHQRRLAGAVLADQPDHFVRPDLDGDVASSACTPGKDLADVGGAQHGGHLTILRRMRSSDSATAAMIIRPCTVCWM